jgi:phage replication-related protein YjqB (UPF0714/DUF867 family)
MTVADKYATFSELAQSEGAGRDFRVRLREHGGATVVIAPHGGGIEPGTSEVADAIADDDLSFYAFEGIRPAENGDLHITSVRFDEPRCLALVGASPRAISIHGEECERPVVFLGGRDGAMLGRLRKSLSAKGFSCETHESGRLQGLNPANICNRTPSGLGVQLELSKGLRRSFFESLSRSGRRCTTQHFNQFVAAVREAVGEGTTPAAARKRAADYGAPPK